MTKWFDTNYHHLVPELEPRPGVRVPLGRPAPRPPRRGAGARHRTPPGGARARSRSCALSKRTDGGDPLELLDAAAAGLRGAASPTCVAAGATAVPARRAAPRRPTCPTRRARLRRAYAAPAGRRRRRRDHAGHLLRPARPHAAAARRRCRSTCSTSTWCGRPGQLDAVLAARPPAAWRSRSALVDGRNLWRSDLESTARPGRAGDRRLGTDAVQLAPSCSLLHLPVDLVAGGRRLDPELRSWLAFATERLDEIGRARHEPWRATAPGPRSPPSSRPTGGRRVAPVVAPGPPSRRRRAASPPSRRTWPPATAVPRPARRAQHEALHLPAFPDDHHRVVPPDRATSASSGQRFRRGEIDARRLRGRSARGEPRRASARQEELGLDVLVHGEFERTDMVEYFGDQLDGFATTANGWVQSYGSRCVKPPVLFGDVVRPAPMTVEWATYAASLTDRPDEGHAHRAGHHPAVVVRPRRPARGRRPPASSPWPCGTRSATSWPPACRHPDRRARPARGPAPAAGGPAAVPRLGDRGASGSPPAASPDARQIHTHMCYAEFGDDHRRDRRPRRRRHLDGGVPLADGARSTSFAARGYPNEVGPGRLGHPLAARAHRAAEIDACSAPSAGGVRGRAAVGQPRLRAQDPRLARGRRVAHRHGRRRPPSPREPPCRVTSRRAGGSSRGCHHRHRQPSPRGRRPRFLPSGRADVELADPGVEPRP